MRNSLFTLVRKLSSNFTVSPLKHVASTTSEKSVDDTSKERAYDGFSSSVFGEEFGLTFAASDIAKLRNNS